MSNIIESLAIGLVGGTVGNYANPGIFSDQKLVYFNKFGATLFATTILERIFGGKKERLPANAYKLVGVSTFVVFSSLRALPFSRVVDEYLSYAFYASAILFAKGCISPKNFVGKILHPSKELQLLSSIIYCSMTNEKAAPYLKNGLLMGGSDAIIKSFFAKKFFSGSSRSRTRTRNSYSVSNISEPYRTDLFSNLGSFMNSAASNLSNIFSVASHTRQANASTIINQLSNTPIQNIFS